MKDDRVCEIGMMLHTALRKCCDSAITSAAYNFVSIDDSPSVDAAWSEFTDLVAAIPMDAETDYEEAMPNLIHKWNPKEPAGMTLHCILRKFDRYDWEGFTTYLRMERT